MMTQTNSVVEDYSLNEIKVQLQVIPDSVSGIEVVSLLDELRFIAGAGVLARAHCRKRICTQSRPFAVV